MPALSIPDINAIAEATARKLAELPPVNQFVLNREDAMHYVRRYSDDSFDAWRKRWKVKPCSHGRYSRRILDYALKKESYL